MCQKSVGSQLLEQHPIEVLVAVIEASLGLVQMNTECAVRHSVELSQAAPPVAPEAFDAVDVLGVGYISPEGVPAPLFWSAVTLECHQSCRNFCNFCCRSTRCISQRRLASRCT